MTRGFELIAKGYRASLQDNEDVLKWIVVRVHNSVNVMKITDLHTLHG